MNIKTIKPLADYVRKAGDRAAEGQIEVSRGFKNDGSIITHIDRELNEYLSRAITELYPEANLITEETAGSYDSGKEYTFAVDPVDGTDAFSQFMPGWCVSVGLLKNGVPEAGIVYAPLWGGRGGSFLFCDLDGSHVSLNGKSIILDDFSAADEPEGIQVASGSRIHQFFDYSSFQGKVRTAGAAVINIVAPLIHSAVGGTIITPCNIWDIAAAHAIVKRAGLDFAYYSGDMVDYSELYGRNVCRDFVVSGYSTVCSEIRDKFVKKNQKLA
jgi:myo-inositol-1(or 4)-monophosphatase